jgi:cell division protein FtsI (penicillin-binding protein 3)
MKIPTSTHFYQTPAIRIRLTVVILAFAVLAVGMLARSTWIQLIGDPKLEVLAKKQFQSKLVLKPRRGLILDTNGEPLAINLETSSLAGNPSKIIKDKPTLLLLSRAMGVTVGDLKKRLNSKKSFMWLERHITDDRLERFKKTGIIQITGEMPEGLWIIKEMKRIYPHGSLAGSMLGTVNIDTEGLEGVELWKESELKGTAASLDAIKDALGRPAFLNNNNFAKIQDGSDVALSIDTSLQYSVEQALEDSVFKTKSQSGMVIVMDSVTGEILALAQNPTFNPNQKRTPPHLRKLRALTDGYEPGSTLKPILVAAALQQGMKISDSLFGHNGKFVIQNKAITEAEAHEKFGYITLKKMLEVSSNIVAAELALKIGGDAYTSTLKNLGFGLKSGTQFPGEFAGRLPKSPIKGLDLASLGFGQNILVTPLQMVRAYATLANGGYEVEPTLLKPDPKKLDLNSKRAQLLKSTTTTELSKALLAVTGGENGTGKKAQVPGFKIAGKTGTAQTVDPKTKRYSTSRYISSFIGYPIGTKRSIVVLTLLDQPRGIYYASETAAPLFSQVMKQVVSRFSIPATEPLSIQLTNIEPQPQDPQDNDHDKDPLKLIRSSALEANEKVLRNPASGIETKPIEAHIEQDLLSDTADQSETTTIPMTPSMPSLMGLTAQEAMGRLKSSNPRLRIHGFGTVKRQLPEVGAPLKMGARVTLFLND